MIEIETVQHEPVRDWMFEGGTERELWQAQLDSARKYFLHKIMFAPV